MRSPMASAFSRFTSPGRSRPEVTRSVSPDTSAVNPRGVIPVTVRHTPCTQIESPTATSARRSAEHSTSSGSTRTIFPTACTMPVNMAAKGNPKPIQQFAELLVEQQCRSSECGDQDANGDRVRCRQRAAGAEVEDEGCHGEPDAGGEVQPLRLDVVEAQLEVSAERERQTEERGVGGGRFVLVIARGPRRHGEPEAEGEARPVLPFARRRGHTNLLDVCLQPATRFDSNDGAADLETHVAGI